MRGKPLAKNTRLILRFVENKRPIKKTIAPHPPSPSPREFGFRVIKFQVISSEFTRRGGAIFHNQKPEVSAIGLAALTTGVADSRTKKRRILQSHFKSKWINFSLIRRICLTAMYRVSIHRYPTTHCCRQPCLDWIYENGQIRDRIDARQPRPDGVVSAG